MFEDGSFSTDVFSYHYDEEKQGYLVPVTSSVAQYTPEVEKIRRADGKQYVTVGYIPTATNSSSNGELSLTAPTEPTKYMDYVFTQGSNHEWYLTALQESEMKPAATPTPTPTADVVQDAQSMVENNLGNAMADTNTVPNEEPAPAQDAQDTPPEGEDSPPEDGGDAPAEDGADSTAE